MDKLFVLDLIFRFLSPKNLLTCMRVNKNFCKIASSEAVWKRHKERVFKEIPKLAESDFLTNIYTYRMFQNYFMVDIVKHARDEYQARIILECILQNVIKSQKEFLIVIDKQDKELKCTTLLFGKIEDTFRGVSIQSLLKTFNCLVNDEMQNIDAKYNETLALEIVHYDPFE